MPPTVEQRHGLSWQDLCEDPRFAFLDDLPFKVETNRWGQIVMSPTRFKHGFFQSRIALLLEQLSPMPGASVTEPAIETPEGVKVADVGWFSAEHMAEAWESFAVSRAPAICVEVLSPGNAPGEIVEKRRLYFGAGAREVWTCDLEGRVRFFEPEGERKRSALMPAFPTRIGG